jgi:hypothetical protein
MGASMYLFGSNKGCLNGLTMAKNSVKTYFLVVLEYFSYQNGPNDLDRGLFSSLDIGPTSRLHAGRLLSGRPRPLGSLLGPAGGAQMAKNSRKKVLKGHQVGWMCGQRSKPKNKPLFKSLGPFQ